MARSVLRSTLIAAVLLTSLSAHAEDCNQNGIDDALDLVPRRFGYQFTADYLGHGSPAFVTLEDFDGDGDLDLAAANRSGSIAIFFNDGRGSFPGSSSFPGGRQPVSLMKADFDGDGRLDLAAVDRSNSVLSLIWNAGKGLFTKDPGSPALGSGRPALAAAVDLDGDGKADIAMVSVESDLLQTFVGDGNGAFRASEVHGLGPGVFSLIAADLDGDRRQDLAAGFRFGIRILRSRGDGAVESPSTLLLPAEPSFLAAADLDGDGDADLLTANRPPGTGFPETISMLFNDGAGGFATPRNFAAPGLAAVLALADLNGDRRPDLVASDPSFGRALLFIDDGRGGFSPGPAITLGEPVTNLAAGDLNGDGAIDLACVAGGAGRLAVFLNNPRFPFRLEHLPLDPGVFPTGAAVADLDGDEAPDLVASDHRGLFVLLNDSAGRFLRPARLENGSPGSVVAADLDGDGDLDLAAPRWTEDAIGILRNRGDGKFHPPLRIEVGGEPWEIAAADLDGNGDLDLAVASLFAGVTVLLNIGSGNFESALTLPAGVKPMGVAAADLDGDRHPDLAVADILGNSLRILLNTGRGRSWTMSTLPAGALPFDVIAADLDGDGDLDLASANPGSRDVWVFTNDGNAAFGEIRSLGPFRDPRYLAAVDLDGDSDLDLAVIDQAANGIAFLINRGDGTFEAPSGISAGYTPIAVLAADLDGDRDLDFAVPNLNSRDFSLFFSEPLSSFSPDANRNGVPDECERSPFRRGDPDGDGRSEITDAVFLLEHLFLGGAAPGCLESADSDNDGEVSVTDAVFLLGHLLLGGPAPAAPGPPPAPCGPDPDPPASAADLGCIRYDACDR